MPNSNDLSGRVGLDVTDYKTAVAAMNREIRVIESGFRATAAALGDWGKSVDGLEARIQSLTSEMDVQQRKVSALSGEYARIVAAQGESSKAAQDLQIRLNKETETLNRMGVELGNTQSALDGMGSQASGTAGEVDGLSSAESTATASTGRFQGALDGLRAKLAGAGGQVRELGDKVLDMGKKLAVGLAAAVTGAAIGLGALVVKTAATADEMVELGDKTGLSIEQIQELSYIGDQTGTSLDTVTTSLARLIKNMGAARTAGSAQGKAFKELGISVLDANGNLRDSQVVFGEAMTALGGIENETQRDVLAMALFGKSAQELNPLISLGADGMAAMSDEAHKLGAVMSDDAVRGAADLNDQLGALKAGAKGIAGQLASKLAPAIGKIVDKFREWLQSPAVQEGIKRLSEKIGSIADKIGEVITKLMSGDLGGALGEIFPPETVNQIMEVANSIRGFINDTLIPFVTTHAEEIKGAVIAIGAALAAAGIVSLLMSIANPIGLIIAAVGLLGAAWAGNWGGIRDKLMEVWSVVQPKLKELWDWLSVVIPPAIQALADYWNTVLLPALQAIWNWISTNLIPIFQEVVAWLQENLPPAIQELADFWNTVLLPALTEIWNFITTNVIPVFQEIFDWLKTKIPEAIAWVREKFITLQNKFNEVVTAGAGIVDFLEGKLLNAFNGVKDAIENVIAKVKTFIQKLGSIGDALPDWLIPGSPTPFEMGLRGISNALDELNRKGLPEFSGNLNGIGGNGAAAGVGGGVVQQYNLTIHSSAKTESVAADYYLMRALARS